MKRIEHKSWRTKLMTPTQSAYRYAPLMKPEKPKFQWPSFSKVVYGFGFFGLKGCLMLLIGAVFHSFLVENASIPHIDPLIVRVFYTIGAGEILGCIGVMMAFFMVHFGRKMFGMKGFI